jgi:biopolymer transport protein ExbD
MTPMVDVAFLLLIFFMSTTTIKLQEETSISLPTSHAENAMPDRDRAVITVHEDGTLSLAAGEAKGEPVAVEEIGERVASEQARNRATRVLLFADGDVAYGRMNELIGSLQRSGVTRFSLVTDVEEG